MSPFSQKLQRWKPFYAIYYSFWVIMNQKKGGQNFEFQKKYFWLFLSDLDAKQYGEFESAFGFWIA